MTSDEYRDLVEFLGGRFTAIDQGFVAIDQRFDRTERELHEFRAEVLGHFDELYRRLDRLEQEYYAITQALRRIETLLGDEQRRREVIEGELGELKRLVATLHARIEDIEGRLRR